MGHFKEYNQGQIITMTNSLKHLYSDEYFKSRDLQDEKRLRSFLLEKEFMKKYVWGEECAMLVARRENFSSI